ncbi:MAG: thioredoxin domain-containing protein, partial [Bacteroidales bacterium]
MKRKANRLIDESSPYLKQHAYNPVNWYPWGEEALNIALQENKLIFISIGYSACHWCHVMERESFSNDGIAKLLNENYICIKIDREERPDLDQTYMSAVQLMSGGGGWPLNCFTTPEGKPFYGGTYFKTDQFIQIIEELNKIWINEPDRIINHAEGLCEGIKNSELVKEKIHDEEFIDPSILYKKMKAEFDSEYGEFNRVPKFPLPSVYQFLFRYYHHTGDQSALQHAIKTLDNIINGGIYDQIGGGLSRYSTDKYWLVPHFEKMLYDNAQFISLLSDAYMLTKNTIYKEKIHHVVNFLERELSDGKGGYYSALDADSEGEEGKYYTWKEKEIREIAGGDHEILLQYYGISKEGNWEDGKNILAPVISQKDLAQKQGIPEEEVRNKLNYLNGRLMEHREMKERPGLDDKILTSWNALMIKALAEAYQSTGEEIFKEKALKTGNFLLQNMIDEDFKLYRASDRKITGFLDDYAFTSKAFILLYQVSFDEEWLNYLQKLINRVYLNFFDEETGMFFYSPDNESNPVARQLELTDSVIPSSNSALAKVLFYASIYFDNSEYLNTSRQMLLNIQPHLSKSSSFFSNWLTLLLLFEYEFSEIVIVGD